MTFRRNRPQQSSGSNRRYPFLKQNYRPDFRVRGGVIFEKSSNYISNVKAIG